MLQHHKLKNIPQSVDPLNCNPATLLPALYAWSTPSSTLSSLASASQSAPRSSAPWTNTPLQKQNAKIQWIPRLPLPSFHLSPCALSSSIRGNGNRWLLWCSSHSQASSRTITPPPTSSETHKLQTPSVPSPSAS